MKNSSRQNLATALRKRVIQITALLFVLYAFADVTVLQAYCGNEAVGIPPAHHLAKESQMSIQDEKEDRSEPKETNIQQSREDREDPDKDCKDDECFCCCSHAIAGYFFIKSAIFSDVRISAGAASYENKHPNSDLTHLFRPPRTA